MKKLVLITIGILISLTSFAQLEKRNFEVDDEGKEVFYSVWDKMKLLKDECFLADKYVSVYNDTVDVYVIFNSYFDDDGKYIAYNDEFIDFRERYIKKEVFKERIMYGITFYTGIFYLKNGDKAIVESQQVVRPGDERFANFHHVHSVTYKKGDKLDVHRIFNIAY